MGIMGFGQVFGNGESEHLTSFGTQRLRTEPQHLWRCGWQQSLPHPTVWPGLQRQTPRSQVWVSLLQHTPPMSPPVPPPAPALQHRVP